LTRRRITALSLAVLCAALAFFVGSGRSAGAAPVRARAHVNRPPLDQIDATRTSVSVGWPALGSGTGTVAYALYKDGRTAGWTWNLHYTIFGLSCGSRYRVSVKAAGAPGIYALGSVSTSACASRTAVPHRVV